MHDIAVVVAGPGAQAQHVEAASADGGVLLVDVRLDGAEGIDLAAPLIAGPAAPERQMTVPVLAEVAEAPEAGLLVGALVLGHQRGGLQQHAHILVADDVGHAAGDDIQTQQFLEHVALVLYQAVSEVRLAIAVEADAQVEASGAETQLLLQVHLLALRQTAEGAEPPLPHGQVAPAVVTHYPIHNMGC